MKKKPNIVLFLVDDMGYGDLSCLNPEGKIKTPNFDKLAEEGMIFTDAHSTSSVCSPSRYSTLTGRYNWRSTLQRGIVLPFGKSLIKENIPTIPKFLKQHGYNCGIIGKWHLGMDWDFEVTKDDFHPTGHLAEPPEEKFTTSPEQIRLWEKAFSKKIKGGPIGAGFDYFFGVDIPNWPPFCFIENERTIGIPSTFLPNYLLGNKMASIQGPAMPYWNFHQLLPTFAEKSNEYIRRQTEKEEPFFLYFSATSPHTPLAVNKPWIGSSGLNNLYADFVIETDYIFGELMKSLEKHGVADNTLVIFTSDNGCAPYIGVEEMEKQGHYPSYIYRGYKSDAWDGGHRMPFIAKWKGVIKPGSTSDKLICLTDIFRTCADILETELPPEVAVDSVSILPLFQGHEKEIRKHVVHHSIQGKFAIRDKDWKLLLCPGSGGWSLNDKEAFTNGMPVVQLYNMKDDPEEKNNVYTQYPEQVRKMISMLEKTVTDGRSTPGPLQQNETEIDIWKLNTIGADKKVLDDL
jgi:arylsulfatase A-like enzyme